jgi:signal transduction histidine kinase/CheY-like chemotaxis protein
VLAGVEQVFREGYHFWSDEYQFLRFDGSYATVIDRGHILYDPAGQPIRMIGAITDISERKRLEAQFLQAQKMEAIGHLTAGIAHDFNNLLTAINGFAELMQMRLLIGDPLHEMVNKILHAGQRAANLVRQLLTFSRKQIIAPEILDLNTIVTGTEKMLRRIIGEHIQMTTRLAPNLWPIQADPSQMEQIIVNLAVNARDAMPSGGKLLIETANVFLDEEFTAAHLGAQPGPHVLLAISDTGSGMSETVKAHLFEPFFTTKEMGKGTGLGLATVYGIVKQGGGSVWVYSEVGQGTTFKIYLPRIETTEMPMPPPTVEAERPTGSETILLVEDAAGVRDLAQRMLEGWGYTVLVASNGPAALELAKYHPEPIHLLLTDVVMPGLNGKALAEQLTSTRPGLKVLFMSGYTDEAIAHHGMLDPRVFLLQKPFSALDLAHKVREVLDADQAAKSRPPDRGGN